MAELTADQIDPVVFTRAPVTVDGQVVGHVTSIDTNEAGISATVTIDDTDAGRNVLGGVMDEWSKPGVPEFPAELSGRLVSIGPISTKPERCGSCGTLVDPMFPNCRCFD